MAIRTTEDAVADILDNDSTIKITPFIVAASSLVDKIEAADSNSQLSQSDFNIIETWLAAHFYTIRDQQYEQKKTGDAEGKFQGETGKGLDSSHYGQMAKTLDITGYLADLDTKARNDMIHKAGVLWGGTEYSEANENVH